MRQTCSPYFNFEITAYIYYSIEQDYVPLLMMLLKKYVQYNLLLPESEQKVKPPIVWVNLLPYKVASSYVRKYPWYALAIISLIHFEMISHYVRQPNTIWVGDHKPCEAVYNYLWWPHYIREPPNLRGGIHYVRWLSWSTPPPLHHYSHWCYMHISHIWCILKGPVNYYFLIMNILYPYQ